MENMNVKNVKKGENALIKKKRALKSSILNNQMKI